MRITILLLTLLLLSCGPQNKLKRAERLIEKAEKLGAKWGVDTVYKEIPVFIPQVRVDSIFTSRVGDTVILEKDRLTVKYVRLPGDSVFIEGECKADTVKIEVPVEVNKEIKSGYGLWDILKFCLFTGVLVWLITMFYLKVVK